jgi:hypothetical protein
METIMTKQPPTLDERINVALQADAAVTSADLGALIQETETEIAKADKEYAAEPSLDPGAAHQAMMATLVANRLRLLLLPKLLARYQEVHEREQAAAWRAEREAAWLTKHDTLKRERDALVAELRELREVYADVATKTANLFGRIAINNEALAELHRTRPSGMEQHLVSAELLARGLDSFSRDTPSLLTAVHLVDWDSGRQIWPLPPPSMASAFATTMVPASGRFSAEWWKDSEQGAARQRAEGQRHADYLARLTKEQDERQNREARESFMAQQQQLSVNRPLKP